MTAEKSRDEYMKEATQLLNHGDQAAAEGGEISSSTKELLLLTRGRFYQCFYPTFVFMGYCKLFTNWQVDQWKTRYVRSRQCSRRGLRT
jgi:hypothetical protein